MAMDVKELQNAQNENYRAIRESLSCVQNAKDYKLLLLKRRFVDQFIRGSWAEKKDFLRWVWSKLTRKDNGARWLREFDPLENVKTKLEWAQNADRLAPRTSIAENSSFALKREKQVFIFAGVPFYDIGGGQRSAQLARIFNSMGYAVYYIHYFNADGVADPYANGSESCPAVLHTHIDAFSIADLKRILRKNAVFIFEIPAIKYKPFFDYANGHGISTVYEHIDNWDTSLGAGFYEEGLFRQFVEEASLVTVTARLLGEKIKEVSPGREYLYLPNAVNSTLFEPMRTYEKPVDLVQGKKTLLYFGSLWGEWFDWEKVIYVAEHCPCEINLIGGYGGVRVDREKLPANIHFLGEKKQDTLPAYLAHSDIALLPFKNSEIGKYVSPLKIFEYIAMNKPVLATPLDDISGYPNVFASDDKEEWAKAVAAEWPVEDAEVFTSKNSWYARCNAILKHIAREEEPAPKISVIILNHNNKKVIFRCVSSLLAFNERYNCEIIVVDNDSTDGSYEELERQYGEKIVLVKNAKNGCSSGRNLGVKAAHGEYLFFLDSDQWAINETYLDNAIEILRREGHIGAVGWAAGWFSPGKCAGPIADYYPNRAMESPQILFRTDIAYLGSGGLLLKKTLFDEIGGFDERYDPTCFEDTDLSLKIRHAGYELAYCPYIGLMHLPHQTTQSGSDAHHKLMEENGVYFMKKWQELEPALLEYYI